MSEKQYEYLCGSMAGTYWVSCKILAETHVSYTVSYIDPFHNVETTVTDVDKEYVKEIKE